MGGDTNTIRPDDDDDAKFKSSMASETKRAYDTRCFDLSLIGLNVVLTLKLCLLDPCKVVASAATTMFCDDFSFYSSVSPPRR